MNKYLLTLILLILTGCSVNQMGKLHPVEQESQSPSLKTKTVSGELDINTAFCTVFGDYNNMENMSEWKVNKDFVEKHKLDDWGSVDENTILYVKPILIESFKENNIEKKIIITKSHYANFDDCHACGVIIGGMVFSRVNNEWKLDIDQRYVTMDGEFGDIKAKHELVKIGNDRCGILLFPSYFGPETYEGLILITRVDNELKSVLDLTKSGNNANDADGEMIKLWSYDSKYSFIPKDSSEYYNFNLITTGTMYAEEGYRKIIKVNKNETYSFDNGSYTKVQEK